MFADIKSKRLIVFKGLLFGISLVMSAGLLLFDHFSLRTGLLLGILIWSSGRLYYFLFYVLHVYVDPSLKYSGIWNLIAAIVKKPNAKPLPDASSMIGQNDGQIVEHGG